ncbi:hypothetical protein ES708_21843 [subsurface metagenome]
MNSGTIDAIGVGVILDTDNDAFDGQVRAVWNISENTAGGGNYMLQFGWMSSLENSEFRADREKHSTIFNLSDTTEAGTGNYTRQLETEPRTVSRAGITKLGPFTVGSLNRCARIFERGICTVHERIVTSGHSTAFHFQCSIHNHRV